MRLLFLNHNLREQGTWFRAFHLARELARLGHELTVVTASPNHYYRVVEEEMDGVQIVETPSWNPAIYRDDGWGPLDLAYRLGRVVLQPFDLLYVFAHPPTVYGPAWLARRLLRKPVVMDWCDPYRDGVFTQREAMRAYTGEKGWRLRAQRWTEGVEKTLEPAILRLSNGVTVISKDLERAALAEGTPPERILRFPSGANVEAITPREKESCRRELGIEGDGPLLGYVANYNPDEKFFLETLALVFRKYPAARLLAACPAFNGDLARESGVAGHLIELGRLPFHRMAAALGAADVLLLPLQDNVFNRGRWPNKFGDYLAAGRPIASNSVGDIADWFPSPDSPDAIGIAAPCHPDAFAEAIGAILDQPRRWPEMGAAGRRLAETSLNWKTLAARVEPFLRRCAAAK